jgi:hypothetical protein
MSAIAQPTLADLEARIERGLRTFIEVGSALLEIRDRRLYRETGYTEFDAYCRERWGFSRQHAHRQIEAAEVAGLLSPNGDGPGNEAQARELVPLLREDETAVLEVWRDLRTRHGDAVTAEKVREAVSERLGGGGLGNLPYIARGTGNVEWYTPAEYIESARYAMGGIDLDPASSFIAQKTVRATVFFTMAEDALASSWSEPDWDAGFLNEDGYAAKYMREGFTEGELRAHYREGRAEGFHALISGGWFDPVALVHNMAARRGLRVRTEDGEIRRRLEAQVTKGGAA